MDTSPFAEVVIHNAFCDICNSAIKGDRFKCIDCPDFDSCASCYAIVPTQHPRHRFARLREPKGLESVPRPIHRATCNECGNAIRGIRYKCMHPACNDFDLCANCEALPIPIHPATHAMLKIREPAAHIPVVERYEVPRVPIVPHTGVAIVEGDWPSFSPKARTKQTARKSTGGKSPRRLQS